MKTADTQSYSRAIGGLAQSEIKPSNVGTTQNIVSSFRRFTHRLWVALLALTLLPLALAHAATSYSYDALGRITQVVESDGTTTAYSYDANGNVLTITRTQGSTPISVTSVSTSSGAVGSTVTFTGTGFSTIPSQDVVTFNGAAGSIVYASGTRIVVSIPTGSTSGAVSITTPNGTTTAASEFTVVPISVSSFVPLSGIAGNAFTVGGGGFDPTAANDTVKIGNLSATVNSASSTQLQVIVPAGATPGHVSVSDSLGTATSAGYFFVPEFGFTLGQISQALALAPGGPTTLASNSVAQSAVGLFDGTVGEQITLGITGVTLAGTYTVFAPDGSQFAAGPLANNSPIILENLGIAGTYSLYLTPTTAAGSASVTFLPAITGTITADGTSNAVTMQPGQRGMFTFAGTAGASYSVALAQFTTTPAGGSLTVNILNPDGSLSTSCGQYTSSASPPGNCDFTLGSAGVYTVQILPAGALASSNFNLLLNQDFTATLVSGTPGPATNATLLPGQHARIQFSATAGQTLALYVGAIAISPSNASVSVTVTDSSGNPVASGTAANGGSTTFNLPNLSAGTYTALITPNNAAAAGASFQANLANGVLSNLSANGTAADLQTWVPGQAAYLSFTGAANQSYGFGLTQLALTPSSATSVSTAVAAPDGTALTSATCYATATPGCGVSLAAIPASGTYGITLTPSDPATMAFAATLTSDVTGTLSIGTPLSLELTAAGQQASVTFTIGSGQSAEINLASLTTTPSGGDVVFYVYNAAGQLVAQTDLSAVGTVVGGLTPGTYTILVSPDGAAGATLQLSAAPGATGTVQTNGTPMNLATGTAGQNISVSFSAAAGGSMDVALTNIVGTPDVGGALSVTIYKPDGTWFGNWSCPTSGCVGVWYQLPETGTYQLVIPPVSASQTLSLTATATVDSTTALTLNTPTNLNMGVMGQAAIASFTTSAAQSSVAFNISGVSTTPSGGSLAINLYNSSGTYLTSTTTTGGATLNLTGLQPDTYYVLVYPQSAFSTAAQVTVATAAAATLASDGTSQTVAAPLPGQNTYLSFSGTAGQSMDLALTGLSPATGGYTTITIYKPDGGWFGNWGCYFTTAGCQGVWYQLPETGTYSLVIPPPSSSQTTSLTAAVSQDLTRSLTFDVPSTLNLTEMGQAAIVSFTTTAGQSSVAFNLSGLSTSPANGSMALNLYNSSGTYLTSTTTTSSTTMNWTGLQPDTYYVLIYPQSPFTSSAQVSVNSAATASLASNGTAQTISTAVSGQNAYLTFNANAGQAVDINLQNLTLSDSSSNYVRATLYQPNGTYIYSWICYVGSDCIMGDGGQPATGTYSMTLTPGSSSQTMSVSASAPAAVSGALTFGTPYSLSINTAGQSAALTFTPTAGQSVSVSVSGITTSPVGVNYDVAILDANMSEVTGTTFSTSGSINLGGLSAQTYTVWIVPHSAVTGSMQVTVN